MIQRPVQIRTKLRIVKGRPDLTPLVDVLFLLLIFFMLSSSFVEISGVEVSIPETDTLSGKRAGKVVVSISEKSVYYFNDQPISWDSLRERLSNLGSRQAGGSTIVTLVVRADRKTPFGDVARLLALAEKINLSTVLATVSGDNEKVVIFDESK
jgi:biopolymer transport protein ExbD